MIDDNFRPRLRHCTLIEDGTSDRFTIVIGHDHFELDHFGNRESFLRLKSVLDGRHTIVEIAERTGLSRSNVIAIVDTLQQQGWLQSRHSQQTIPAGEFIELIEGSALMWRRQIGLHKLFRGLANGSFRPEVFFGLLIEVYHYVRLLPEILGALSGGMRDQNLKRVVSDYVDQEASHHKLLLPTISTIDWIGEHIERSHPTVGTLSLVRNFETIGRSRELSLICCLQLVEARSFEVAAAANDFRAIAANYSTIHLIEPYINHMLADVASGHSSILGGALLSVKEIAASDAHAAANDMHDIKHAFDAFHDSIVQYYEDVSNFIPRRPVDYFAL